MCENARNLQIQQSKVQVICPCPRHKVLRKSGDIAPRVPKLLLGVMSLKV